MENPYRCSKPIVFAVLLAAYILVGNACGSFFPEAVFVQTTRPDGKYSRYVAGHIGVPQPGYRIRHLVAAYDWLNGTGLSPGEQEQAVALSTALDPYQDDSSRPDEVVAPDNTSWPAVRHAFRLRGEPKNVEAQPGQPGAGPAAFHADTTYQQTDRKLPGNPYETFPNCLEDAFATAARTLKDREAAHPGDTAALADWVRGQDAVFTNCGNAGKTMPPDTPANAPLWLRQDRAYQKAAANFYQTNYTVATQQLHAIAMDAASPWHETARFIAARAAIRFATVGQDADVPPNAIAPPNAPYTQQREKVLQAYENSVSQQQPTRLKEARRQVEAILADSAMAPFHNSAAGLLDFVNFKIDPVAQANVLAGRLSTPKRSQAANVFYQALTDLSFFTSSAEPESYSKLPVLPSGQAEMLDWIRTMAAAKPYDLADTITDQQSYSVQTAARRAKAAQQAVTAWHAHRSTPWLLAALTVIEPGNAAVPELLRAAAALPIDSPAAVGATYQRLRLTGPTVANRAELLALLPSLARQGESRSTINLFTMLLERSSPTFDNFLATAGMVPTSETDGFSGYDPLSTKLDPDGLCHTTTSPAATPLFNHDTATILNTRLPLRLLAQAAANSSLPANLHFQIAQAAWARAVLLNRPEIAQSLTPVLTGCYASWQPVLAKYDSAATAEDREANGLLALMRFASTEPVVRDGEQRVGNFPGYDGFRDDWWPAGEPSRMPHESSSGMEAQSPLPGFFDTVPATTAELPDPLFLTVADRTTAAEEVGALRKMPCASDYFARAALAWQQAHPADGRTADILGNAERVIRNGCSTDATKELNHRLFVVVQLKYAHSKWARKYPTWQ